MMAVRCDGLVLRRVLTLAFLLNSAHCARDPPDGSGSPPTRASFADVQRVQRASGFDAEAADLDHPSALVELSQGLGPSFDEVLRKQAARSVANAGKEGRTLSNSRHLSEAVSHNPHSPASSAEEVLPSGHGGLDSGAASATPVSKDGLPPGASRSMVKKEEMGPETALPPGAGSPHVSQESASADHGGTGAHSQGGAVKSEDTVADFTPPGASTASQKDASGVSTPPGASTADQKDILEPPAEPLVATPPPLPKLEDDWKPFEQVPEHRQALDSVVSDLASVATNAQELAKMTHEKLGEYRDAVQKLYDPLNNLNKEAIQFRNKFMTEWKAAEQERLDTWRKLDQQVHEKQDASSASSGGGSGTGASAAVDAAAVGSASGASSAGGSKSGTVEDAAAAEDASSASGEGESEATAGADAAAAEDASGASGEEGPQAGDAADAAAAEDASTASGEEGGPASADSAAAEDASGASGEGGPEAGTTAAAEDASDASGEGGSEADAVADDKKPV